MNRQKNNLLLLNKLKEVILKFPELRFIQVLFIMNIIDKDKNDNIIDRFYEEPNDTLNRCIKSCSK